MNPIIWVSYGQNWLIESFQCSALCFASTLGMKQKDVFNSWSKEKGHSLQNKVMIQEWDTILIKWRVIIFINLRLNHLPKSRIWELKCLPWLENIWLFLRNQARVGLFFFFLAVYI